MSALFILVICSLLVATGFLVAFIWSIKNDQYEDFKGSSWRALFDDKNNS
ncbi:MAG: cbb3-type cytochrome oxidase assembly protein CcoS [Chitinophagia bacterium]|nr:cbb3-type cytochrome oxidase assembly protein CcoS [Chitinophagia bacterium]